MDILPVSNNDVMFTRLQPTMSEEKPKTDYTEELLRKIQQYNSELEQRIRYLNGAWTLTTGIRSTEVIGEFLPDLFDGDTHEPFREALLNAIQTRLNKSQKSSRVTPSS